MDLKDKIYKNVMKNVLEKERKAFSTNTMFQKNNSQRITRILKNKEVDQQFNERLYGLKFSYSKTFFESPTPLKDGFVFVEQKDSHQFINKIYEQHTEKPYEEPPEKHYEPSEQPYEQPPEQHYEQEYVPLPEKPSEQTPQQTSQLTPQLQQTQLQQTQLQQNQPQQTQLQQTQLQQNQHQQTLTQQIQPQQQIEQQNQTQQLQLQRKPQQQIPHKKKHLIKDIKVSSMFQTFNGYIREKKIKTLLKPQHETSTAALIYKLVSTIQKKKKFSLMKLYEKNKERSLVRNNSYLHFLFMFIDRCTVKDYDQFKEIINGVYNIEELINQQNLNGHTPLHLLLIENSGSSLAKLLVATINYLGIFDYSKVDDSKNNVLYYAIENGDIEMVKLILLGGCSLICSPRSKIFKKNFKNIRQQVFRVMELREVLTKVGFMAYLPMCIELDYANKKIIKRIPDFIKKNNPIDKQNSEKMKQLDLLLENDKRLDLDSFCTEYDIKDNSISEISRVHFRNVLEVNPYFGYIDFQTQIGSAGNASVYEGSYQGTPIACKEMPVRGTNDQKIDSYKEIAAVGQIINLGGKTVVKSLGLLKYNEKLFLIMVKEKCNLLSFLNNKSEILKMQRKGIWTSIFNIIDDILIGLISIREADMYHRDFKTANFLVTKDNKILVSDFGTGRDENEKRVNTFVKKIGTLWYRCPRLGDCDDNKNLLEYNEKSEIYSFGIILWELVCVAMTGTYISPRIPLFQFESDFYYWIHKDYRFSFPIGTPNSFVTLITNMCLPSREKRPTIYQVYEEIEIIKKEFLLKRGMIGETNFSGDEAWKEFRFSKEEKISTTIQNLHSNGYNEKNIYTYTQCIINNSLLMKRYIDNSNFIVEFNHPQNKFNFNILLQKENLLYKKIKSTYHGDTFELKKFFTFITQWYQLRVIYYKKLQKIRELRQLRDNGNSSI
ncbi:hypothetical protein ACTFIV_009728 [Dictyostelium citrinum]